MRNIYTPADIERITEATIGNPAEIAGMEPSRRARAYERRASFISSVGEQVASEVAEMRKPGQETVVFAGDGICGAYALEAALELMHCGGPLKVILFNIGGELLSADTRDARDRFVREGGRKVLQEVINPGPGCFEMPAMNSGTLVIDGIFGSEYRKPLRGGYQAVARSINESKATVVSIDLPSGMTTDLSVGMVNRNIIHADVTLTLIGPTLAFFMPENAELLGRWKVLAVPFDEEAMRHTRCTSRVLDSRGVRSVMPPRPQVVSKADLGEALIFAGSYGMLGAAVLATRAATRSGCGKVTCHGPRCGFFVMQSAVPSAMFTTDGADVDIQFFDNPRDCDGVAIGPGIGRSDATAAGLSTFLKSCYAAKKPLVLDADALNIISDRPELLDFIPPRSIITPHAGEFDRLFGAQNSHGTRTLMALEMAQRYKIVILLKGPKTLTVWPDGSILVNSSGTEALATAGSGDVLTGLIAGLMAQKIMPEIAAAIGAYIHGVAGRIAARTCGIQGTTAEDIADAIGPAIDTILNPRPTGAKTQAL